MKENYMEQIYDKVARKALESLDTEKATKISEETLELIALTERLHKTLYSPV